MDLGFIFNLGKYLLFVFYFLVIEMRYFERISVDLLWVFICLKFLY